MLHLRTEASITLNFFVYIQNVYLNQTGAVEETRFPYIPEIHVDFNDRFPNLYNGLWNKAAQTIAADPANDLHFYLNQKESAFQALRKNTKKNTQQFNEIDQSFYVWWNSTQDVLRLRDQSMKSWKNYTPI